MKKISMLLVTIAMVLTMAQCKKNEATDQNKTVTITLDVKSNNGAKVNVNPVTGTVDFETGDKVYVGSGGKYVGLLTHNGTNFVGNITNPMEEQPLQFYFLGNVTPNETLSAGTTEFCSVVISDQTEHLPVISCAASNENYVSGVTAYSAHLLNKCALVKFNVTTPSNSPICVTGMKNKVTVDFTQNTMTPSMDGEGVIMLPAGSGENVEKWAILLPQEALEEGGEGSAYSEDGVYSGIRPMIPAVTENEYLADGITMTVIVDNVPVGAINGLFTINENGDQVYFSQGNLQYQASTNTWRFAENQWDFVGTQTPDTEGNYGGTVNNSDNADISHNYNGWIDLFGWGTSGYNHGAICYQPWSISVNSSDYCAYGGSYNLYDQTGMADWGCNVIANGGNEALWRSLTKEEWNYILFERNTISNMRYAKANVNGVCGMVLFPDYWDFDYYQINNPNNESSSFDSNIISADSWNNELEVHGTVFLPVAGDRIQTTVRVVGVHGRYWTSSFYQGSSYYDPDAAYYMGFYSGIVSTSNLGQRHYGRSVRLVQNYIP